jgi:hypothetical protein
MDLAEVTPTGGVGEVVSRDRTRAACVGVASVVGWVDTRPVWRGLRCVTRDSVTPLQYNDEHA